MNCLFCKRDCKDTYFFQSYKFFENFFQKPNAGGHLLQSTGTGIRPPARSGQRIRGVRSEGRNQRRGGRRDDRGRAGGRQAQEAVIARELTDNAVRKSPREKSP